MKRRILFCLILWIGIYINSFAQTVDEVINEYVEANGGIEKLNQLKYVTKVGILEQFGEKYPLKLWISNLKGFKSEIEMDGFKNYSLVNPEGGFLYFPITGEEELKIMPDDIYKQAVVNLNILPAFINYAENKIAVFFKGTIETDSNSVYKLEVIMQNAQKIEYFIDKKSGYLIKSITYDGQNYDTPLSEIKYSDFRVVNDKYIFPFNMADKNGTFQFTNIEVNVPINDDVFKP